MKTEMGPGSEGTRAKGQGRMRSPSRSPLRGGRSPVGIYAGVHLDPS